MPAPPLAVKRVATTRVAATADLGAVLLTSGAVAHAKAAGWTPIVAETFGPGMLLAVTVSNSAAAGVATDQLLDLGIAPVGAAADTETVLIPDLNVGYTTGGGLAPGRHWRFPIFIPSGYRISGRLQARIASDTLSVALDVFGGGGPLPSYAKCRAYGLVTASSRGTILTAGAAIGTKGAWAVLAASTAEDIRALVLATGGASVTGMFGRSHLIDVGYGAAASEKVIAADLYLADHSNEFHYDLEPGADLLFETPIPAGSRLVARQSASAASDATVDLVAYGLR